jgi:hypothetical protein
MNFGEPIMKRIVLAVLILGLIGAVAAVPAFADSTLYSNSGNGSYTFEAWSPSISDSFTLSQDSTVTGVNLILWFLPADSPTSVTWQIDSSFTDFDSSTSLESGTSAVVSPILEGNAYGYYPVYQVSIAIPSLALDAGTYWLELDGINSKNANGGFWNQSGGSSIAYDDYPDFISSESFQILGTPNSSATPEPSSFLLLGSGLAGLAGLIKRKLAA